MNPGRTVGLVHTSIKKQCSPQKKTIRQILISIKGWPSFLGTSVSILVFLLCHKHCRMLSRTLKRWPCLYENSNLVHDCFKKLQTNGVVQIGLFRPNQDWRGRRVLQIGCRVMLLSLPFWRWYHFFFVTAATCVLLWNVCVSCHAPLLPHSQAWKGRQKSVLLWLRTDTVQGLHLSSGR